MQPLAMPDLVVACWVVAAVLVAWVVVTAVRRYATRATPRDPQRLFDTAQKSEAFSLAGGRCEFETPLLHRRCSRPGRHADHWIPWTLGGASSGRNLVVACAPHNLAKGATVPSRGKTARLARRRRRYYPVGVATRPGQRYVELYSDGPGR